MTVLIACEFSGKVRNAFINKGIDAISVDLLPSEQPGPHYEGDIRSFVDRQAFSMMIAFPPCTYLASSGARWFNNPERKQLQEQAIAFVEWLWELPIPRIAIENPVGILATRSRLGKSTQVIQPYDFGHPEIKTTCLWLKNLPLLKATKKVYGRTSEILDMPARVDRRKERSITYDGVALAMADQWGSLVCESEYL